MAIPYHVEPLDLTAEQRAELERPDTLSPVVTVLILIACWLLIGGVVGWIVRGAMQ